MMKFYIKLKQKERLYTENQLPWTFNAGTKLPAAADHFKGENQRKT